MSQGQGAQLAGSGIQSNVHAEGQQDALVVLGRSFLTAIFGQLCVLILLLILTLALRRMVSVLLN